MQVVPTLGFGLHDEAGTLSSPRARGKVKTDLFGSVSAKRPLTDFVARIEQPAGTAEAIPKISRWTRRTSRRCAMAFKNAQKAIFLVLAATGTDYFRWARCELGFRGQIPLRRHILTIVTLRLCPRTVPAGNLFGAQ
jgi:hypothetical protein